MAIIAPNTDIILLQGVPLNDYQNTFFFATASDQYTYFYSKRAQVLSNYTFQRNNGRLRCSVPAETAMQYNYMMYRNTSFGNKWFYAFIRNAYYINNETSEIEFEIDAMQTWFFEYTHFSNLGSCTIDECFIQRQHAANDSLGSNIIPEPVEVGEYIFNGDFVNLDPYITNAPTPIPDDYWTNSWKTREYIVAMTYVDNDTDSAYANLITYGLSGLKIGFFYPDGYGLRTYLTGFSAAGQPDAVKALAYVPRTVVMPYIKKIYSIINNVPNPTDREIDSALFQHGVVADRQLYGTTEPNYIPEIFKIRLTIPHIA